MTRQKNRTRRHAGAIRKLPSGRYQARLRDPLTNRLVTLGSFPTVADADAAITKARTDQGRGAWVRPERLKTTVGDWCERWYETTTDLRPSTRKLYRWLLDTYVDPAFGDAPLGAIDALTVRRWLAGLHSSGLSKSTVAKAYRVLSQAMSAAVESGYLAVSPCVIRGAGAEPESNLRCPTIVEVLSLADAVHERHRAMILLAGLGGLRIGELAGLRRHRVDLLHRRVDVAEQVTEIMGGELVVGPPKTRAGVRTVALPAAVVEALAVHLEQYAEPGPDGLVFPAPSGGYMRRSNFNRRVWIPATKAVGVEGLRFHDLRHAAATLAASTGATTKELMARIGHASPVAALRYQHVVSGRDAAIADGIDALVGRAEMPTTAPVVPVDKNRSGTYVARDASGDV